MPTIKENKLFTVIIEWEVDPQQQQALIDALSKQVERHFKSYPGFVSASFHASDDGQRVINYAQWLSKESWSESFQASGRDKVTATNHEAIRRCGAKTVKIDFFCIARVVENV
ncbi:antibiotic biosynthesis monooxygenase family protein [Pseudalkalibacillus sp. A8]|uniref:antibiotic biosynthesis monooxygenase family protein n=1 Tax=Pseudalkalibacillus sp. A8 TaxID=3382641 RepID=UPI0038B68617